MAIPGSQVPPSREALEEALSLSEEIVGEFELSENQCSMIVLKVYRLARLLNDPIYTIVFDYESKGYPSTYSTTRRQ